MKDIIIKILRIAGILLFNIILLLACILVGCIFFSPNEVNAFKGLMLGVIFYMIMLMTKTE